MKRSKIATVLGSLAFLACFAIMACNLPQGDSGGSGQRVNVLDSQSIDTAFWRAGLGRGSGVRSASIGLGIGKGYGLYVDDNIGGDEWDAYVAKLRFVDDSGVQHKLDVYLRAVASGSGTYKNYLHLHFRLDSGAQQFVELSNVLWAGPNYDGAGRMVGRKALESKGADGPLMAGYKIGLRTTEGTRTVEVYVDRS